MLDKSLSKHRKIDCKKNRYGMNFHVMIIVKYANESCGMFFNCTIQPYYD